MVMAGSLQKIKRGKDVQSREIVQAHLPPHWANSKKKKNFLPREQILSFESYPQF